MRIESTTPDPEPHNCSVFHWDKQHGEYRCIDCDTAQ